MKNWALIGAGLAILASQSAAAREPFFALASPQAASVRKCRLAALTFDTKRTRDQAQKVVKACEAEGYGNSDHPCRMYAVRVASAAQKFVSQMDMIAASNPGWLAMGENVKYHNREAQKYARQCRK